MGNSLDRMDHLTATPPELLEASTTSDELHRRRAGEPVGFVPEVGDRIRYAMRHDAWTSDGARISDFPVHTAQGPWSAVREVRHARDGRYSCVAPNGDYAWIDLDWWICEQVIEDGALW